MIRTMKVNTYKNGDGKLMVHTRIYSSELGVTNYDEEFTLNNHSDLCHHILLMAVRNIFKSKGLSDLKEEYYGTMNDDKKIFDEYREIESKMDPRSDKYYRLEFGSDYSIISANEI